LVHMWAVFGHGKALGAPPGQPPNIPGQPELDRVDHAALARAVRPGDRERALLKIDIELPDAPDFFDMRVFELDHLTSPPAGSEKIVTKSSTFGLFVSANSFLSCSILPASTSSEDASFARYFSVICC